MAPGITPEPLMIDFTTRNQTLCDFTHCDTPCLTPSVYAALPVPCLSADEVTVDYTANLKEVNDVNLPVAMEARLPPSGQPTVGGNV